MKMILGRLHARPGLRPQLLKLLAAHRQNSLTELGCLSFEALPMLDDENAILLVETYVSADAHWQHDQMGYMKQFIAELPKYCASARVENVVTDDVVVQEFTFD